MLRNSRPDRPFSKEVVHAGWQTHRLVSRWHWNNVNDNTNVWRVKSLFRTDVDQICYYSAGVGTAHGERLIGGILGYGLDDEVIRAYEWLTEHYEPEDRLFIFGFSRGAYTARALAGFISVWAVADRRATVTQATVRPLSPGIRRAQHPAAEEYGNDRAELRRQVAAQILHAHSHLVPGVWIRWARWAFRSATSPF